MQTNALEQARVESAQRAAAEAQAMRLVAIRMRDARRASLPRTMQDIMQAVFCLAIGLTMTTIAINSFLRWLGW
jgi:hypothetical protein